MWVAVWAAPPIHHLVAVSVGVLMTNSSEAGSKVAVVSSREQYETVLAAGELPELRVIVVMDGWEGLAGVGQKQIPFGNDKQ